MATAQEYLSAALRLLANTNPHFADPAFVRSVEQTAMQVLADPPLDGHSRAMEVLALMREQDPEQAGGFSHSFETSEDPQLRAAMIAMLVAIDEAYRGG